MNTEISSPHWQLPDRYLLRIAIAVAGSLLFHGFLLSLQFGVFGLGLPGLTLPWSEHRALVSELSIRLANIEKSPQSLNQIEEPKLESIKPAVRPREAASSMKAVPPSLIETPLIIPTPAVTSPQPVPVPAAPRVASPDTDSKISLVPEKPIPKVERSNPPEAQLSTQEIPQPKIISKLDANPNRFTVPPAAVVESQSVIGPKVEAAIQQADIVEKEKTEEQVALLKEQAQAAQKLVAENAKRDRERELRLQEEANAKRQAMELEAQKQMELAAAAAKKEASAQALQKQEQAALKAKEEASRQAQQSEALRLEKIKQQELAKLELDKQEKIKLEQERQKQEKIRQQALELEAKRQAEEAARQRALALERQKQADDLASTLQEQQKAQELAELKQREAIAAQQQQRERERVAAETAAAVSRSQGNNKPAEPVNIPRNYSGSDLASRAYEQVKKLDLSGLDPKFRPSASTSNNARRKSIFGSVDKEFDLRMYIENWRQKIERNGRLNYKQSSIEKATSNPLVTVAIRSDGSVEEIIINRSSGRPELDEAVRRIVGINARYSAFPPNLAREYDVIEIRRVWNFDDTLKVLEEGR
ncbi:MAG TPA: energy transducer TonB [Burkholderiaceae bacterium]|jgi:hypothetical protein